MSVLSLRSRRSRAFAVFAILVLALAVVSGGAAKTKPKPKPKKKVYPAKVFNIAQIGPLSGQNASLGTWDWQGISLAARQIDAKGGVFGVRFHIDRYDDQGDPTTANNLAQQAVSKHYNFVYGSALSTNTLAMIPVLTAAHIPEITSGQSDKLLAQGSNFIFMNSTPSSVYDATLAKYAIDKKGYKRVAMLTNNDAYGKSEHDAFLAELKSRGLDPVADQVVTPDATDMTGALSKIRDANPTVLFIGAEEVQSGLTVKQARSLGIKAVIAEGAPAATPLYVSTAGVANVEGTIVSSPYLSNDVTPQTKAFAAAYKKAWGVEPELHGAKAYDGMMILAAAIAITKGNINGDAVAAAMHKVKYKGLLGKFAFDSKGLGLHDTQIGIIKKGALTIPADS
jgi:branched-chain amino acid transport system substrate-binding protein